VELRTFSKDSEYYSRNYDSSLFEDVVEYAGDDAQALHALRDAGHIIVGADSSVAVVERLNLYRGTLKSDPSKILARCDKVELAKTLNAAGLPVVPQEYFTDREAALRYAKGRGFPQVLKPRASGGTDNVTLVWNDREFLEAFNRVATARSLYDRLNSGVLVMDYICPQSAEEFVIDSVTCDGRHVVTDIWKYEKTPLNGTPAMYRSMRLLRFAEAEAESAFALRMVEAAGYREGASHTELWRTADSKYLPVEIGFRLPGLITAISADATGRDQVDLTLDSVLDPHTFHQKADALDDGARTKAAAVVFIASNQTGRLKQEAPLDVVKGLRSYHSSAFKATKSGDLLRMTVDVGSIAGWVGLCCDEPEVLIDDMNTLRTMERSLTDVESTTP
jgi:biotin carboxylase